MNAVHTANTALNTLVNTGDPINSPVWKYVNCFIRTSERLHAANSILKKENEALQAVVTIRKAQLSGKRKVIEGKHLLTTVEICAGVVAAENASKKRKVKGTQGKKNQSKAEPPPEIQYFPKEFPN